MQENVEGAGCRNCASYKRNVSVGIICLESDVVPQVYTPRVLYHTTMETSLHDKTQSPCICTCMYLSKAIL